MENINYNTKLNKKYNSSYIDIGLKGDVDLLKDLDRSQDAKIYDETVAELISLLTLDSDAHVRTLKYLYMHLSDCVQIQERLTNIYLQAVKDGQIEY